MAEYTVTALTACLLVVLAERFWLRTGLFRTRAFWMTFGIVIFFQVLVDGWLTKLSSPVVIYSERFMTGWRYPFDIPIEDYAFGFALITLALLLWSKWDNEP